MTKAVVHVGGLGEGCVGLVQHAALPRSLEPLLHHTYGTAMHSLHHGHVHVPNLPDLICTSH